MKKRYTRIEMDHKATVGRNALDVYAVLCVQARGQGSCSLNVNLIQGITNLPVPDIVDALDALVEDGTIYLKLAIPGQDHGAAGP